MKRSTLPLLVLALLFPIIAFGAVTPASVFAFLKTSGYPLVNALGALVGLLATICHIFHADGASALFTKIGIDAGWALQFFQQAAQTPPTTTPSATQSTAQQNSQAAQSQPPQNPPAAS